jgi:hypothetical protein
MRRALLTILVVLVTAPAAWGQGYERQILLGVLLATEARQVATCQWVGFVSDNSPEDLRKKILARGGNAGLVMFDQLDPDKINATVYRCQPGTAAAPPPATPADDPTAIQRMLLGTWSGTLRNPPAGAVNTALPATLRVWDEGGQLRFALEVAGQDLGASGTVTHFFSDITLTGTSGERGLPVIYSLRLNGPALEGTGAGPDPIPRTLSVRKQP